MASNTFKGLGAYVPLDYSTDHGGRFEHAIVVLPQTWNSMYDLIYSPAGFMDTYRGQYADTPAHHHYGLLNKRWGFEQPITVQIQPLTLPGPATGSMLQSLDPMFPGLGAIGKNWATTTPRSFLQKVLTVLQPYRNGESGEVSAVNASEAKALTSQGVKLWPMDGTNLLQPAFRLQYVAEFAIRTRALRIWYVPQASPPLKRFSPSFALTTTTLNPVKNTDMTLMHVDVDFGSAGNAAPRVADARARFATEFIVDPAFMNSVARPTTKPFLKSNAPFLPTHPAITLPQSQASVHPNVQVKGHAITIGSKSYHQPTLTIDSVWPEPPATADDPDEPLCMLFEGNLVEIPPGSGHWFYWTGSGYEKAYSTPPEFGSEGRPDNGNSGM